MITVERIPIMNIIGFFLFYLIAHFSIGFYVKYLEKNPEMEGQKETLKWAKILFKVFPALYVIGLLIYFY
jgi:hypothetical protein